MKCNSSRVAPLIGLLALAGISGCTTIRNIEQWKCDNWGLCHFGIKPTPKQGAAEGYNSGCSGCNSDAGLGSPSDHASPPVYASEAQDYTKAVRR